MFGPTSWPRPSNLWHLAHWFSKISLPCSKEPGAFASSPRILSMSWFNSAGVARMRPQTFPICDLSRLSFNA